MAQYENIPAVAIGKNVRSLEFDADDAADLACVGNILLYTLAIAVVEILAESTVGV